MSAPVVHISPVANTPFNRRMSEGHEIRYGHPQDARMVSADGRLWHRVRLCCGEPIPTTITTWDELT